MGGLASRTTGGAGMVARYGKCSRLAGRGQGVGGKTPQLARVVMWYGGRYLSI